MVNKTFQGSDVVFSEIHFKKCPRIAPYVNMNLRQRDDRSVEQTLSKQAPRIGNKFSF